MTNHDDPQPAAEPERPAGSSLEDQPSPEASVDQLMTVQETADLLGLTAADLAQMRAHGTGPAWGTFTTRVVRYDRDEVLHWVHTHPHHD